MFLAIGLAARRSRALFLSATLQGTSSTIYDVSSREQGGTLHTYAHLRPGSQCALSAHMHVDTCSDILPELPFLLMRGCWHCSLLRAPGLKPNAGRSPTLESTSESSRFGSVTSIQRWWVAAQSATFSQGFGRPVGGCPEIHRPAKVLLRPPRLQLDLPCPGRAFLATLPGSARCAWS
jgi:hypothetical protein